jgi:hypothetical protein
MSSKDFKAKLSSGTLSRLLVNKMLASVGILSASMAGSGASQSPVLLLLDD